MDPINEEYPFLRNYQPSELKIASELLTTWLPFLSNDLCKNCHHLLSDRIHSLVPENFNGEDKADSDSMLQNKECEVIDNSMDEAYDVKKGVTDTVITVTPRMSWADMTPEEDTGLASIGNSMETPAKRKLSREQREQFRFMNVKKMKTFTCFEKVKGKSVNILEGLELHTGVFSAVEQKRIVDLVYELQEKGRKGELKERTFTAPHKWMRGKGRVTIQFGCCYNYAADKAGNPPGILQHGSVDPIPSLFKVIIRRLVGWHVIPPTCVPDSCIVNIYEEGDCIPPHIDNHDFLRPFCTISFLAECDILFGSNLKILGPGEFSGSYSLPLPVGSVLVLKGNGADVAKHCVPAVPTKRISITFRKMDESKRPVGFTPEPDLQGIKPLPYEPTIPSTPVSAAISSSRSNNDQNGSSSYNNRAAHRDRSKHHDSRSSRSETREWSSSNQKRGNSRPSSQ